MDGWESNQRVENTNPMETSGKLLLGVNILINVIFNNSKFCRLNTLNSYCNVYDDGNETNAKREQSASLSVTHSSEAVGTILKTIVHDTLKLIKL
jgi:hypothetical protein